jgi:hypothetical protein
MSYLTCRQAHQPRPSPCGWFAHKEIGQDNSTANQEGYQK